MLTSILLLNSILILTAAEVEVNKTSSEEQGNVWEKSGMFEGDIVRFQQLVLGNGLPPEQTWPLNTLIYKFSYTLTYFERENIKAVMDKISNVSCIVFRPYVNWLDKVYITISNKVGCYSITGYSDKYDLILNLQFPLCHEHSTIEHELLHALGFDHMHSSPNRDDYVVVHKENIIKGQFGNFDKVNGFSYGVPYDLDSVMHYSRYAFNKNRLPTIEALVDPNYPIGQAVEMSEKDIKRLNMMYNCPIKNLN